MSATGIVTFDYGTWAAMYPELGPSVQAAQAQGYFNQACLYLDNTACSPVVDASPGGKRATILYMLTSHIATILAPVNGQAPSPLVGRISNASEGSVSVQTEMNTPGSASWFTQTKYGAMAWQALAPYRTGFYAPAPQLPIAAQSFPWTLGFPGVGRIF